MDHSQIIQIYHHNQDLSLFSKTSIIWLHLSIMGHGSVRELQDPSLDPKFMLSVTLRILFIYWHMILKTSIFTDWKSLFHSITKLSFLIDLAAITQSYAEGEITNVAHILSRYNIGDCFTKENADLAMLYDLMRTGYLDHPVNQWIIDPKQK